MAPTLPDLPVEIFLNIIDHLPERRDAKSHQWHRSDVKTLRQTCRAIESKTRRRFGQEFCDTLKIRVMPTGLLCKDRSSIDETLQDCIRDIQLYIGNYDVNKSLRWSSYSSDLGRKIIERGFGDILGKVRYATGLMIESPCVWESKKRNNKETIKMCLYDVVKTALRTIAAHDQSRLKTLVFRGAPHGGSRSMPMHLLQEFSNESATFTDLTTLKLKNFEWDTGAKHTQLSVTRTVLDDLRDLHTFSPNTTTLEYKRIRPRDDVAKVGHNMQELYAHATSLQPLTKLNLGCFGIGEVQLSQILLSYRHTLKSLTLKGIHVMSGSWRAIFSLLRNKLHLQDIVLAQLWGKEDWDEEERAVTLQGIADQRPLTVDAEAVAAWDQSWEVSMGDDGYQYGTPGYEEKVKNLEELVADGWLWICHDRSSYEAAEDMEFHANEGDDINMWLSILENHYLLE